MKTQFMLVGFCIFSVQRILADITVNDALLKRIGDYVKQSSDSPDVVTDTLSFTKSEWPPIFNQPLDPNNGTNKLPAKMALAAQYEGDSEKFNELSRSLANEMFLGKQPFLNQQSEIDSYAVLSVVLPSLVESSSPDAIPNFFNEQQHSVVTRGDYVVFKIIVILARANNDFNNLNQIQLSSWIKLSQSKNPVYRLIAAKWFRRIDNNYNDWNTFYSSFSQESDSTIIEQVSDILRQTKDKTVLGALQTLKIGQSGQKNEREVKYIDKAITEVSAYGN